jgi:hypothetical protein
VPLPDDERRMTEALMQAVLLRRAKTSQLAFDFSDEPSAKEIDRQWRDAAEREKKNRTIFAQRQLKPEDVEPEWQRVRALLGGPRETRRFVERGLMRLRAPLEAAGKAFKINLSGLAAPTLRERLAEEGLEKTVRVHFGEAPGAGRLYLQRAHPLVGLVAEALLETALDPKADPDDPATLPRCAAWRTEAVKDVTITTLLRLRHRLEISGKGGQTRSSLAEEAVVAAFDLAGKPLNNVDALCLMDAPPQGDLAANVRLRRLAEAVERLPGMIAEFGAVARRRAAALAQDHARVRQAADSRQARLTEQVAVSPVLPIDVIGLCVLLPVI